MGILDTTFAAGRARKSIKEQLPSRADADSCKVICSRHRFKSNRKIKMSHYHPARAISAAQGFMKGVPRYKVTQILE